MSAVDFNRNIIGDDATLSGGLSADTVKAETSVTSPNFIGNASSSSVLSPGRNINGVLFNGSSDITIATGGGTTTNAVTFNNGGGGAASGAKFDGSVARTISYNTIGANPAFKDWSFYTTAPGAIVSTKNTWGYAIVASGTVTSQSSTRATYLVSGGTGNFSVTNPTSSTIYILVSGYIQRQFYGVYSGGSVKVGTTENPNAHLAIISRAGGPSLTWSLDDQVAYTSHSDSKNPGGLSCSGVLSIPAGQTRSVYMVTRFYTNAGNMQIYQYRMGGTRIL